jgi:hypothetical protein
MHDGIDRSGCTVHRHNTRYAYKIGCRCPDTVEMERLQRKREYIGRPTPRRVPVIGSARRLRALARLGWRGRDLAPRCNIGLTALHDIRAERYAMTYLTHHNSIAVMYRQLEGTEGPSQRTRDRAARWGWSAPLLWDGIDLDDPDARPVDDQPVSMGKYRVHLDDIDFLMSQGATLPQAAKQCGVREDSVKTALRRREQRQENAA